MVPVDLLPLAPLGGAHRASTPERHFCEGNEGIGGARSIRTEGTGEGHTAQPRMTHDPSRGRADTGAQ